jgi:hypothetical protein
LVHLSDDLLSATWTVNNNGREELRFSDGASEKGKHLHSSMYVSSVFVSDWWWMPCHITPFYSSLHLNLPVQDLLTALPAIIHHLSPPNPNLWSFIVSFEHELVIFCRTSLSWKLLVFVVKSSG